MENTKNITKITIYYIPYDSKVSTFNITITTMSCELKGEDYPSPNGRSYVSVSKEFTEIFSNIKIPIYWRLVAGRRNRRKKREHCLVHKLNNVLSSDCSILLSRKVEY